MVNKGYQELTELLTVKLDRLVEDEIFAEKIKLVLVGSYAKEIYGLEIGRETNDIDFYCPDAPVIAAVSDEFACSPAATGISTALTDEQSAELFTSLTDVTLDSLILDNCNKDNKICETNGTEVYCVSPALFIVSKVLAYNKDREKDLIDINQVIKKYGIDLINEVYDIAKKISPGTYTKAKSLISSTTIEDFE